MCGCRHCCKNHKNNRYRNNFNNSCNNNCNKNLQNISINPKLNNDGYADVYFPIPNNCNKPLTIPCSPLESYCKKQVKYVTCRDSNGCCYSYPASCRNPFWPEFSKPRWLCCKDLYNKNGV